MGLMSRISDLVEDGFPFIVVILLGIVIAAVWFVLVVLISGIVTEVIDMMIGDDMDKVMMRTMLIAIGLAGPIVCRSSSD